MYTTTPDQSPARKRVSDRGVAAVNAVRVTCALLGFIALIGCSDSGGRKGRSTKAAALALAAAMKFKNSGATYIEGAPPSPSPDAAVRLAPTESSGGDEVELGPGSSSAVVVDVTNPNADTDPVVATLVTMDGASGFFTIPTPNGAAGSGQFVSEFTVDPGVCADLCNIVHQVQCYESAITKSGVVTTANLTTILLECTGSGDPDKCGSVNNTADTSQFPGVPDTGDSANPDGGVARFQGTISNGRWGGSCGSDNVEGSFTMTVTASGQLSGSYSGDDSGSISGVVDATGSFNAGAGTAGSCTWTGQFTPASTGGGLSGSGTFDCPGLECSGSWSGGD